MKKTKFLAMLALMIAFAALATGCGGDKGGATALPGE